MIDKLVVPINLGLRYAHSLGGLAPYFEGLLTGKAVATRCLACGKARCPPQLQCPSDGEPTEWITLAGSGSLISMTEAHVTLPLSSGMRQCIFALVKLDGAENAMLGRLEPGLVNVEAGARLRLARAPGEWPHPSQAVHFVTY